MKPVKNQSDKTRTVRVRKSQIIPSQVQRDERNVLRRLTEVQENLLNREKHSSLVAANTLHAHRLSIIRNVILTGGNETNDLARVLCWAESTLDYQRTDPS